MTSLAHVLCGERHADWFMGTEVGLADCWSRFASLCLSSIFVSLSSGVSFGLGLGLGFGLGLLMGLLMGLLLVLFRPCSSRSALVLALAQALAQAPSLPLFFDWLHSRLLIGGCTCVS